MFRGCWIGKVSRLDWIRRLPGGKRIYVLAEGRLVNRSLDRAHAIAGARRVGQRLGPSAVVLVNLSGRGDKDVATASRWLGHLNGEAAQSGGTR